jgi:hypothetical protein
VLNPEPRERLDIFEEEIPREGVRVTRAFQYARWLDGAPLVWSAAASSRAAARRRAASSSIERRSRRRPPRLVAATARDVRPRAAIPISPVQPRD